MEVYEMTPNQQIRGIFETSYNDHYKNIKVTLPPILKQDYKYEQRHYNSDVLRTSYQDTYIPKEMNNLKDSPSKLEGYGSRVLNQVPFVGQSSYKEQYKPFLIKPNHQNPQEQNIFRPKSHQNQNYQLIKFEGTSSYKAHYAQPPQANKKQTIPQFINQRAQISFNGSSSYKHDFPRYKIQPRKPVDDYPLYRYPQIKFEGKTSYNDEYKGHKIIKPKEALIKSRNVCIVEKLPVPSSNYINNENHIYYDETNQRFV